MASTPTMLARRRALERPISTAAVDEDGWADLHYAAAFDLDGCGEEPMSRPD